MQSQDCQNYRDLFKPAKPLEWFVLEYVVKKVIYTIVQFFNLFVSNKKGGMSIWINLKFMAWPGIEPGTDAMLYHFELLPMSLVTL